MELVQILKHKKTGEYHCPHCFERLKIKDDICFECEKCKMYFALPDGKTQSQKERKR